MGKYLKIDESNYQYIFSYLDKKTKEGELKSNIFHLLTIYRREPSKKGKIKVLENAVDYLDPKERRRLTVAIASYKRRNAVRNSEEQEARIAIPAELKKELDEICEKKRIGRNELLKKLCELYRENMHNI